MLGVALTVVAQAVLMAQAKLADYLPLVSLPVVVAVLVPWYLGSRARSVTLRVEATSIRVQTGNGTWNGSVERAEVLPWIVAGLGTAQGAILQLLVRDHEGKARSLALAAAGSSVAVELQAPALQLEPEFFLHPLELQKLIDHCVAQRMLITKSSTPSGAESRFVLVRRPGLSSAVGVALPWFATLGALAIAGIVLGERVAESPSAMILFAVFSLVLVGGGLWLVGQRSRAPRPSFELVVEPERAVVRGPEGATVWEFDGVPPLQRETYVYRTRYGAHRFAVIRIGTKDRQLRLAVWDPSFAREGDPHGPAPDFLVGVPDWPRLERVLHESSQTRSS